MKRRSFWAFVILSSLTACSARSGGGGDETRVDPGFDADIDTPSPDGGLTLDAGIEVPDAVVPDAHVGYDAEPVDPCGPSACGPEELCGTEGDGDGLDNNCDGQVDEGCLCKSPGESKPCFAGPPDRRGLGSCADGVMVCNEFLIWSECGGGVSPTDETCDGADNDCNGRSDDGLSECTSSIMCPGTQAATPLNTHRLLGTEIYSLPTRSQHWEIACPDTVTSCPTPSDADAADTDIYFVQSGTYRAHYEVVTDDGGELGCDWVIRVGAAGLRVELTWDTQGDGRGDTDVDLHLHRRSVAPRGTGETDWFNTDDCYYANCKGSLYSNELETRWALAPTDDLAACSSAPHGEGEDWSARGSCANPRLDVDVITCDPSATDSTSYDFCSPENVNVDTPAPLEPYRIMVNYFSAHSYSGDTHPKVAIFCNGELRGMFEPHEPLDDGNGSSSTNDNWLVADVQFNYGECGEALTCEVTPLDVIQNDDSFGPAWSY